MGLYGVVHILDRAGPRNRLNLMARILSGQWLSECSPQTVTLLVPQNLPDSVSQWIG